MFSLAPVFIGSPDIFGEGSVVACGLAVLAGWVVAAITQARRQAKVFVAALQAGPRRIFRFEAPTPKAAGGNGLVPPGVWQAQLGNRMHAFLHLHGNGTFRADMVAYGLIGQSLAATESARGRWYPKGNGVLFQVESGVSGLPFASGLLEVAEASDDGFSLLSNAARFRFERAFARRTPEIGGALTRSPGEPKSFRAGLTVLDC